MSPTSSQNRYGNLHSNTSFKVAVCQPNAKVHIPENLERAERLVDRAVDLGADLALLPENFAFMGTEQERVAYVEDLLSKEAAARNPEKQGPIMEWARRVVTKKKCWLLLGGIPERSPDMARAHNTAVLLDNEARIQGVYRKIHLFDLYPEDAPPIVESESTYPGDETVVVATPWLRVGLSICYDLRFPELYRNLVTQGAQLLCIPAAFTQATGRDHWETLVRARAIENLSFVAAANLCGEHFPGRASYGHSRILDPWGNVLASLGEAEGVCVAQIQPQRLYEVRKKLPALNHRRL